MPYREDIQNLHGLINKVDFDTNLTVKDKITIGDKARSLIEYLDEIEDR